MSSIREIITSLQSLKSDVSDISGKMQRESEYINETISKVYSNFSDQPAGQKLVTSLNRAMLEVTFADSTLYRITKGLDDASEILRQ
jgi:hypothetical protein